MPPVIHNIKRYPDRRFYDDVTSSVVTLKDLMGFVLSGEEVMVFDTRTKKSITNPILALALSKRLSENKSPSASPALLKAIVDCCKQETVST